MLKVLLLLAVLGLSACNIPVKVPLLARPSPTPAPLPTPTATPAVKGPIGTKQNPIVLALPPSTRAQGDVLSAGDTLLSILKKQTGYDFVSVIPPNETDLINGMQRGDAHIASLSPFAYLLASERANAEAAFAREQDGAIFYGAEFIASGELNFLSYFDAVQQENVADASVALAQFAGKKPCWTDRFSPSGYVVPLGILRRAGVSTREPAFLSGHPAVVRAVYAGGICDFGGTYVDAILYPGLEDELPDVTKRIVVIWRIAPIIPYETLAFSRELPLEMRRLLTRTFVDLMETPEGKAAVQTLYGFSAMQIVTDGQYDEFRAAVRDSGLDLQTLVEH